MIIFLDFDGVLHEIACTSKDLFSHAPRFSEMLRDHPNLEVVISSDWRKGAGSVAELVVHFDPDVRHRFVGWTGIEGKGPRQRERECWQWLRQHGREHVRWIAIDDCPDNFGPDLPGAGVVLFTDPSVGLDDEAVTILRAMIATPAPTTQFCYV